GTRLRSKLALPRRRNRFSTASTHSRPVAFRSSTRRNLGNRLSLWTETRGDLRTGPTRLLYVYSVLPVAPLVLPTLAETALSSIANALSRISPLNHQSQRIAITGLQRAGKTVFITSLTHALLNAVDWPAAAFPFFPWRGLVQSV